MSRHLIIALLVVCLGAGCGKSSEGGGKGGEAAGGVSGSSGGEAGSTGDPGGNSGTAGDASGTAGSTSGTAGASGSTAGASGGARGGTSGTAGGSAGARGGTGGNAGARGGTGGAAGSSGGARGGTTGTAGASGGVTGTQFPLTTSTDGRYLVDARGTPRPIMGRTAWGVVGLSAADRAVFLDDTVARGFNAIETQIPTHIPTINNVPKDGAGNVPFSRRLDGSAWNGTFSGSAPDMSAPNETYWAFVDVLVNDCLSRGLLLMMFPAYLGIGPGDGWDTEMTANGTTRVQTYGAFVANRYKNVGNIVWMTAGDTAQGYDNEAALIAGIKSVTGASKHFSAERQGSSISSDGTGVLGTTMTLDGAYAWTDPTNQARRAYAHTPVRPAYLLEEPYDQEGSDGTGVNVTYATQPVRRYEWWGWLSAIEGYVAGNGYIWTFKSGWQQHLDTQNTRDLTRLNAFMQARTWWQLVPSGMGGIGTLVTAGGSTVNASDYVAAAATPSGTLLIAYVAPAHTGSITIDMTKLSGAATARWFDPTTAAYTVITGSPLPNTGTQSFTPPSGTHGDGARDWVLVLETSPPP